MINSPEEKAEKARAFKKLMSKWLKVQETKTKADLLLARNPEIKIAKAQANRKAS